MSVTFGEEPTSNDRWRAVADSCREHPGEWGRVDLDIVAKGYPSLIRGGKLVAFRPAGTFEAKSTRGKLWIRYVGHLQVTP